MNFQPIMYGFGMLTFWFLGAVLLRDDFTEDARKWFIIIALASGTAFIFSIVEYLKEKKD